MGERPIEELVRFSRLASEAQGAGEILELLARDAGELLGVTATAVLRLGDDGGVHLVASQNLPPEAATLQVDAEVIGPELETSLLRACGDRFARADLLPLIAAGDLFGTLVLLRDDRSVLEGDRRRLAGALADLAAIALHRAAQTEAMARSYAELRASREALARSEKLRALGQMAAGVAHDLKNILNPLSLRLQLLRRQVARDAPAAGEGVDAMAEIIRLGVENIERLRAFSRQEPEQVADVVDLDRAVTTAIDIVRPRVAQHPEVTFAYEPGRPPPVLLSGTELVNAIVNLLLNAIEAMPDGGSLRLATEDAHGGACVRVSDTGPGMPADVQARVFEPFFTTKREGTGLGLATVYAFVQRSGGTISVESSAQGTHFALWFPAAA